MTLPESMTSAKTSASASMIGTCTIMNSATRLTPSVNALSLRPSV
jgi:hypothetical protein